MNPSILGPTSIALAIAALTTSAALAGDPAAQQHGSGAWRSLVGTWLSEVTHVDCVSGSPTNPPVFQVHESFHLGGTYTQFGAVFGNRRSTGMGSWRRTGKDTFEASFTFFRFDDATGAMPVAIVKVDRLITMSGANALSSVNKSTVTTPAGVPLLTSCATEVGIRF